MMQKLSTFLLMSMFTIMIVSCKNETKINEVENTPVKVTTVPKEDWAKKKVLTEDDRREISSIMFRIIDEQDLKKFASYSVSAGLTEMLSTEKGPFTVFVPTNAALESLTPAKVKFYSNPENKQQLEEMVKSHIVAGSMNKEDLLKAISKSGKAKLQTLGGVTLTASKVGDDIVISDGKNGKATIQKSDILGSNGIVYVIDGVMNAN